MTEEWTALLFAVARLVENLIGLAVAISAAWHYGNPAEFWGRLVFSLVLLKAVNR